MNKTKINEFNMKNNIFIIIKIILNFNNSIFN